MSEEKNTETALSAREVLVGVYDLFKQMGREIVLPKKVCVKSMVDSTWYALGAHVRYESFVVLTIDGKKLAVTFGDQRGDYSCNPYSCVISVVSFWSSTDLDDNELSEVVSSKLISYSIYDCSLIRVRTDGKFAVNNSGLYGRFAFDRFRFAIENYIVNDQVVDSELMTMDGRPLVKSKPMYKPELAQFLYELFIKVLLESK